MNPSLPAYWTKAKKHLSATDPVMANIIRRYKGETLQGKGDPFQTLARAITGQQISVKAADAVWNRLFAGFSDFTPAALLAGTEEEMRGHGLSRQKVVYMKDLSRYFHEGMAEEHLWGGMTDDELIASLTSIKGIGRWTAEMFLIFHLLRPDVFPVDDIAVLRAIEIEYFGGEKQTPKFHKAHAEKWRPYRSVATWYLWRTLDPVPVEY